ncbi:MAG: DUF3168 domain-containing protein [Castellaniella sp.]|nr:DUF3168 domain-containing protein [Castellaniella sp.]
MSVETELFSLLKTLVDGRCYPDATPDAPVFPLIVYQGAGGRAHDYLERKLPDCEHYRIQINCWTKSRTTANALALQVRQRIIEQGAAFESAETMGQAVGLYEEALKLYGARQDFGVWIKVR